MVLNSCTVTASADEDVRKAVHRVHRENPAARILVTGCYAQRAPQELAALPGSTGWWETRIRFEFRKSSRNLELPYHGQIHVGDIFAQHEFLSAPVEDAAGDRTRPNLKIQDGCNNRCSFCIIPFVRGRSRSAPADQVVSQVRHLAERYREVVLSGINLGRWGREAGSTLRLADLIRRLLDETPIERLRLSSVEPMDWSDDLLDLVATSARIAKHVHAPLQSGSDRVLRRMHRKYRPRHYEDRVLKARALDAGCGHRRRRDDRLPRRDRRRVRRNPRVHREPALHLPARVHLFGTAGNAGGGKPASPDGSPPRSQPGAARTGRAKESGISPADARPDAVGSHAD